MSSHAFTDHPTFLRPPNCADSLCPTVPLRTLKHILNVLAAEYRLMDAIARSTAAPEWAGIASLRPLLPPETPLRLAAVEQVYARPRYLAAIIPTAIRKPQSEPSSQQTLRSAGATSRRRRFVSLHHRRLARLAALVLDPVSNRSAGMVKRTEFPAPRTRGRSPDSIFHRMP